MGWAQYCLRPHQARLALHDRKRRSAGSGPKFGRFGEADRINAGQPHTRIPRALPLFRTAPHLVAPGAERDDILCGRPGGQEIPEDAERLIGLIGEIVEFAIEQKEISPQEGSKTIAWVIFSIYQIEIRHWLSSDELDIKHGIAFLRRQLVLLMHGLSPRAMP